MHKTGIAGEEKRGEKKGGMDMKYGFGIDLGGTTVKLAFFEETGKMLQKWEIPTNTENAGKAILPDIAASIEAFLQKEGIVKESIIGIGLGVPGPVSEDGIVNKCINLGWGVIDLHKELSALTGFAVKAGNDANVAALGECWKGSGQGCQNMVLATLGTGIGGGVVIGGKVISGAHGAGGEIGHMKLNFEETEQCNCGGYGCAEQYCSATGMVRLAKQYLQTHTEESSLRALDVLEAKDIFAAAAQGDMAAGKILEQIYRYLGLFLANVCCVADPEVFVLGGGVSKAGDVLIEGAKKYFERYAFHACASTKIVTAALGNDAGAYGAFKLVLDLVSE